MLNLKELFKESRLGWITRSGTGRDKEKEGQQVIIKRKGTKNSQMALTHKVKDELT